MSIAKEVENYIKQKPSVRDCLQKDLVNFSSLSRQITADLKLSKTSDFDAILVACRRYAEKMKAIEDYEGKIMKLLKGSKLEIKNKISTIILDDRVGMHRLMGIAKQIAEAGSEFHVIQGTSTITIITTDEFFQKLKHQFRDFVIAEQRDVVMLTIITSKEIEKIPGVLAYLTSFFAENGINIYEAMSAWTDTILTIEEKDVPKAMEILKFG